MTMTARLASPLLFAFVGFAVSGCSAIPHDVSFAARCARFMQEAFPGAAIKITKSQASALGIREVRAQVAAVRTDLPKNTVLARDLAVECRFDNGVLTGFRWTKGPEH